MEVLMTVQHLNVATAHKQWITFEYITLGLVWICSRNCDAMVLTLSIDGDYSIGKFNKLNDRACV